MRVRRRGRAPQIGRWPHSAATAQWRASALVPVLTERVRATRFLRGRPRLRGLWLGFASSYLLEAGCRPLARTRRSDARSYPAPTTGADDVRSHRALAAVCDSDLPAASKPSRLIAARGWIPTAVPGPRATH